MVENEKPKLTFEQAIEKLEEIVAEIEEGKVSLEESIERYGEGAELIRQCRRILNQAEKKIQLLAQGQGEVLEPDGELEELEGDGGKVE